MGQIKVRKAIIEFENECGDLLTAWSERDDVKDDIVFVNIEGIGIQESKQLVNLFESIMNTRRKNE